MPSNSPYAKSFQSAIKRGTPCWTCVTNIANRHHTTPTTVFNSLFKAGLVNRQKFNGQWIYWPTCPSKASATNWKDCQTQMWQWFIDFCVCHGWCNPQQFMNYKGSQHEFMSNFKKFWNKQYNSSTTSKPKSKKSSTISRARKTSGRSYKFPTTTRRRKAA